MDLGSTPHRRFNALTGDWVLVSPHRTKRPWQGQVEDAVPNVRPKYDEKCYLCPGNERAGGEHNPQYPHTFVFDNDYAALLPNTESGQVLKPDGFFTAFPESGVCRVLCFSPRHDLTLALMENEDIRRVVDEWTHQYEDLGSKDFIRYVQIFENRGAMMGCSNPHPHGQIWANSTIPDFPAVEGCRQKAYYESNGTTLLADYLAQELKAGERIVFENDTFVSLVPYWAVWPFETLIAPKEPIRDLTELSAVQRDDLADALRRMGIRFDNLFRTSFPYSMGLHQQPTDGEYHDYWHFHIHYFPPLLRSATVKKFMVGYEMLAMPQRDITAEQSAARLRECPETHYSLS